jgi:hypothetical protein
MGRIMTGSSLHITEDQVTVARADYKSIVLFIAREKFSACCSKVIMSEREFSAPSFFDFTITQWDLVHRIRFGNLRRLPEAPRHEIPV